MACEQIEERRLWIGNLDTRLSEYQLLKILQKCGHIDKFDMLFHKGGPQIGQPRGYAFVTYKTSNDSAKALEKLNGKLIGTKNVVVRLAKNIKFDDIDKQRQKNDIRVLSAGTPRDNNVSKEITIRAIEAKLRNLESRPDDFEVNRTARPEMPLIQRYQYNIGGNGGPESSQNRHNYVKHHHPKYHSKPYNKNHRPHKR